MSGPSVVDDLPSAERRRIAAATGLDADVALRGDRLAVLGPASAPRAAAVAVGETQGWTVEVGTSATAQPSDDALVADALAGSLDRSRGPVHVWIDPHRTPTLATSADDGDRPVRTLLQLTVALPLSEPHEIEVRPFRPGPDDHAWLNVNNRAFAWHPEQGGWSHDDLRARMAEPWFDPDGFLLHEVDGRLAGFCWTKEHPPPHAAGEIFVIAVDPDFQGRGLGRGLTLAGFSHLAGRGQRTGTLWVEGDNHAARALYRDLGMTEHDRRRSLVMP